MSPNSLNNKPPDDSGQLVALARGGNGSSLTQQALEAMLLAVRRGAFPSGRLPSEDELAQQLGVSRTTIRHALQSMEDLGLIERRPGRGTRLRTHVKPELLALHGLVAFPTLVRELGHDVTTVTSWNYADELPADLAFALGRDAREGAYELDVLLLADGEPAVKMLERFPDSVVASTPSDDDLRAGSILLLSERCFSEKIHHALTTIEPRTASKIDPLDLGAGKPYLVLHEIFFSAEETPLATSEVCVNPKYITFSVFRRFL